MHLHNWDQELAKHIAVEGHHVELGIVPLDEHVEQKGHENATRNQ